jgi:minor extracellular protease Epr
MRRLISILTAALIVLALFLPLAPAGAAGGAVRVAVIDTGISTRAVAAKNLDKGRNYITPNGSTEDTHGHGTAVAAIIAGSASAGVEGLCPEAVLVPLVYCVKAADGSMLKGDLDMLSQIIYDAVDVYGCRIINISSGARSGITALRDAMAYAESRGVLIVSSAGNDGTKAAWYPGAYSTVLCAGAVNETEDGPASFSNRHSGVDVVAPGIRVPTSDLIGEPAVGTGTSFAAAWVTGLAARLLTADPTLTPHELREIIKGTARDIGKPGWDEQTGWGLADVPAAVAELFSLHTAALPFEDVDPGAYYAEAVSWALRRGITGGTSEDAFSPDMTCTRAQTVTFLWRAAGCPEPRIAAQPFEDVQESDYFYKAVLWAVEKEVTTGTSDTTFSPNDDCTEAQVITLIWRAKGRPAPKGYSAAAAGLGGAYYAGAVAWADTLGLFEMARTRFDAAAPSTRAHIVTYLFASAEKA